MRGGEIQSGSIAMGIHCTVLVVEKSSENDPSIL